MLIAAAANLSEPFRVLGPRFEAATGIHPVFSFASTAELAHQIENGAPFEVFAAADRAHVDQLAVKGFMQQGSASVYANGILALWIPAGRNLGVARIQDLASTAVRVISVAKPQLAPYGEAAVTALKRAGIWEQVREKIVYAQSIGVAKQYGSSGNADAVLTAYSLVLHEKGLVLKIESALYPPIEQSIGVVLHAKHPEGAREFVEFLLGPQGQAILREFGYIVASR